jgi:hypothetical protein
VMDGGIRLLLLERAQSLAGPSPVLRVASFGGTLTSNGVTTNIVHTGHRTTLTSLITDLVSNAIHPIADCTAG